MVDKDKLPIGVFTTVVNEFSQDGRRILGIDEKLSNVWLDSVGATLWNTSDNPPDTDREVVGIHKNNGRVFTNYYPRIKLWRHGHSITHWREAPDVPSEVDQSKWTIFKEAKSGQGGLKDGKSLY